MATEPTLWHLISEASLLVQLVMLILVILSLVTWIFIFERRRVFALAYREFLNFEERFWSGMDLTQLYREVSANTANRSGGERIFRAGFKEFTRLRQQQIQEPDASMDSCQRAMKVAVSKEIDNLDAHLSFLATVGSTSPYIGLLGTVWGIMNSFRGLASVQQVTLATVAPGISEALIATAMGLFAAIPAVIAYNRFAARSDKLINQYETFVEEFSAILQRQAHLLAKQKNTNAA